MKKTIIPIILFTLVIFSFSLQSASSSLELSKNVLKISQLEGQMAHVFIRKAAHFMNYSILSILIFFHFHKLKTNKIFIKTIFICFIVAVVDETIQIHTGRTASFKDVLLDTTGAIFGCLILKKNLKRIKKKKSEK